MRVGFDGRSLVDPVLRGWDRYTVGLVDQLVRLGVKVTLFHRADQPLHVPHISSLGCEVIGLRDRSGLHWEQVILPLALRRGGFNLFHAPAEHGVPLAAPCPVALTIHSVTAYSYRELIRKGLLEGPTAKYVGYEHNRWNIWKWYWHAQVARANHVFTVSAFARDEIVRLLHVPPRRVTVTPLAAHDQFKNSGSGKAPRNSVLERLNVRAPYLLYVGGYELHKNVGGLLDAFSLVRAVRPDLSLVVVGSKFLPQRVADHADRLGLRRSRDVVFLTNITNDLTNLYDGAELFVTLSWRETFCLPALEAMTRGIPVVASAWGASAEVVGEAGRLVDPRDPALARDAILAVLSPPKRKEFQGRALARAAQFSWGVTAIKTLAIYERLTGTPAHRVALGTQRWIV